MTVLDWYADAYDPAGFQDDVLDWLESNGVDDPRGQGIESIKIEQHPDQWTIVIHKLVMCDGHAVGVRTGLGEFEPARETLRLRMQSLQPARP